MHSQILIVDKDTEFAREMQAVWLTRGVFAVQVNAMLGAIEKLVKGSFLFTIINADNIGPLPLLKVLSDSYCAPVFIVNSNYTLQEQTEAFQNGAEGCVPFYGNIIETNNLVVALLQRYLRRDKESVKAQKPIIFGNILISPTFHRAFYCDAEMDLTKIQFDLLSYFVSNPGKVLTYKQIYEKIWGPELQDLSHKNLWNHIFCLRQELVKVTGSAYIETEWNVGYRFVAQQTDNYFQYTS